ncbi:hypothetical protein WMO24_03545 [Ruthenibacterium sp. CLA-JM-H11]|uniref:Uncharacterized protein n=1 Tax=Ruthenibacterium intestinale TaxID=3133163 RepID=A0ABV1GCD1_9FIRM
MTSPDDYKKTSTNNTSSLTAADKLAAMRPASPLPGRTITHSFHPSDTSGGRPVMENDHSLDRLKNSEE